MLGTKLDIDIIIVSLWSTRMPTGICIEFYWPLPSNQSFFCREIACYQRGMDRVGQ